MKLFVTGAQGQVARSLVKAAGDQDMQIMALGRPDLDLTVPDSIKRALDKYQPDLVVNAAAYTAVDRAEEEGEAATALNQKGAGVLALLCNQRGIPFIHLSTDYVYDGSKKSPYVEEDPTAPLGIYGRSKLAGEKAVIAATRQHIILRTAWVYSPFGQNFVKTMLRLAGTRDEFGVVKDQIGSPTYAPHLACAILDIARQLKSNDQEDRWGIYHAAGSGETSWHGMALEIFKQAVGYGTPCPKLNAIPTRDYPTPAKRPANSRLDCAKLTKNFSIKLPDWKSGVKSCVTSLLAERAEEKNADPQTKEKT